MHYLNAYFDTVQSYNQGLSVLQSVVLKIIQTQTLSQNTEYIVLKSILIYSLARRDVVFSKCT